MRLTSKSSASHIDKITLENYIFDQIELRFGSRLNIKKLISELNREIRSEVKAFEDAVKALLRQMSQKEKEINNLLDSLASGVPEVVKARIIKRLEELETKKESLVNQKNQIESLRPGLKLLDEEKVLEHFQKLHQIREHGTNKESGII
ncbi:MAG TPA: hypothetical protein PK728_11850 [Bacillota bacterium]|nr:hypothetical protein [Bacillota bacterium]